jgi:biopolymer transport protein ExbD
MARWKTKTAGPVPAHNAAQGRSALTPMIDVTFLLLLFFLLTFTFRQAEGQIPGSLPHGGVDPLEICIEVVVRPTGEHRQGVVFEIDGAMVQTSSPRELGDRLMAIKRQIKGDASVIIRARGDVQWRWAVEAFNQAVRAEYRFVGWAGES